MESLGSKFLIPSSTHWIKSSLQIKPATTCRNFRYFPFILHAKKSTYQDFQEYAKPAKLLPASKVKLWTDASNQSVSTSAILGRYECLYKVRLQTSNISGSSLTDMNAGVLLCLIDENGSSILQRLPSTSVDEDKVMCDTLHFQRGGIDEFSFEGPALGRIVAVWISLESGQWRMGGLSLSVINHSRLSSADINQENKQQAGLCYNFEVEDILLGENSETSMTELKPYSVTSLSEDDLTFSNERSSNGSFGSYLQSNEESMKEYADLKFSLLFYDSMLILAGSSITSFLTGESALYSFLTGGMCGFLYLLLLQKSVDGLPAKELIPSEENEGFGLGKLKGPVSSLVLAFAFAVITLKYASGEDSVKLTSKDLVFGMMGFLLCKVSVVLSAFKPLPFGFKDNSE